MKQGTKILLGILAVVIVIGVFIAGTYNGLVSAKTSVDQQYANIDIQLQRRSDLIPNLVNTVKGFNVHETEIINSVTEARAKLAGTSNTQDRIEAESELSGALSRLLVVVENYPELKSNENFQQLMYELEGTENRISVARFDYNGAVTSYNQKIKSFPTNIFASMFGYQEEPLFKADEAAKAVPKVEF